MMDITCINRSNQSRWQTISIREEAYQVKEGLVADKPKESVKKLRASSVLELPKVLRDLIE